VKAGDDVTVRATNGLALLVESGEGDAKAAGAQAGGQRDAQPAGGAVKPEGAAGAGAGAAALEGMTATATVESVDKDKRLVTLKNAEGETRTIHLGKEAINFDQIQPGDKVRATLAEEVAISIRKGGAPEADAEGMVALAPKGAKPGMLIANSAKVTGKIQSIDPAKRTLTIDEVDGGSRTIKVGPKVNLAELSQGDDITARCTQVLAIVVEKP
jgi:hypothetical protein